MRRPFRQHFVVQMCILALAIEPSLAFARHGQKKEDGELPLVSVYVGKTKVENVRQFFVPMGNTQGFVIEKLGKGDVLLERIVTWGDKTQIEIDRDGTGYLHEWEAFSDRGHIKMGTPGNGHFGTMAVEILTDDKRIQMSFVRNEEDDYTLVAQSSSPLVPMYSMVANSELVGAPNANGASAAVQGADVRTNIGADVNKLNSTIDNLNKDGSCKNKQPMVSGISEVMRSDTKNPVATDNQKYLQCIQNNGGSTQNCPAPNNNKYLQCLHDNKLDAIADNIDAQFYGTAISSKGSGTPSWSISCQDCASPSSTTQPSTGGGGNTGSGTVANPSGSASIGSNTGTGADLCKGQPKNGAVAPSSKGGGTVSFVQNCQTSKGSSNNSADSCLNNKGAKNGTVSQSDYARTFFHEMLHKNGVSKEADVQNIMNCCAPEDGKKPSCGGMSAVSKSLGLSTDSGAKTPADAAAIVDAKCNNSAVYMSATACETAYNADYAKAVAACGSSPTTACQQAAEAQAASQALTSNCRDATACKLTADEAVINIAPSSPQAQTAAQGLQAKVASYCANGGTDCAVLKSGLNTSTVASSGSKAGLSSPTAASAAAAGGPQMKKAANFNSFYKGVTNAFSSATQIANANSNQTHQAAAAPTMANPTEPHPPFNLATAQGNGTNPAPAQNTVTTVAASTTKGKSEAIAGKTTAAAPKDPAAPVAAPVLPGVVGAAKAVPKNLSAAAQGVREKAKKGDAVARLKFVKQMTQLEPEEMHLALKDEQVQNSLVSYVLGVIDDEGKKRDSNPSPADWLIFNHQAQHLVFKEGTVQK